MSRSVRAVLSALLLISTTLVGVGALSAPASAACTTKVVLPKKVGINKPYTEVKVTLSTSCSAIEYASTYLYTSQGVEDVFIWDPASNGTVEYWDLYDWAPLGPYKTRDGYAVDSDYNELPVTEATTSVRLSSKTGITTSRSGGYVTVKGTVTRYVPAHSRFRPWLTSAKVEQQRADGTWAYVRTLKIGSTGSASTRIYNPKAASYRVRVVDVWHTWGSVSATSRR